MLGKRAGAIALLAGLLLVTVPTGLAQSPPTAPEGLHLSYGNPAQNAVHVTFSGPPAAEAIVEITGPDDETRTVDAQTYALPVDDEVGYRAQIDGLEAGTEYTYKALLDGAESDTFTFQTAPQPDTDEPVRITMFGDHGVPAPPHPDRTDGDSPIENMELAASLDPDVHLLPGDIAYADGDPLIWDIYFQKNEPLWATTPTMTVPGNHEREAGQGYTQYDARLTMPEPDPIGRWWEVQVGNVQVVGLNSDTACAEGQAVQALPIISYYCGGFQQGEARQANERQLSFVEETLSEDAEDPTVDWTVVAYHNPTYSTGSHGSNGDVQALWGPLFEEYGVDVVVNGDDHLYQRTHPLVDGEPADEGPVYMVNGLGGSDTYEFEDEDEEERPEWEAARFNGDYGTVLFEASEDRLTSRFVTLNGTTIDEFTLANGSDGSGHVLGADENATPAAAECSGDDCEEAEDDEEVLGVPGLSAGLVVGLSAAVALLGARRRRR